MSWKIERFTESLRDNLNRDGDTEKGEFRDGVNWTHVHFSFYTDRESGLVW